MTYNSPLGPRITASQITQFTVLLACLASQIGCSLTSQPPPAYSNNAGLAQPASQPTARSVPQQQLNQPVLTVATSLLGVRYRYGGLSPDRGFDCSGFVYYSHKQIGVELPRTSSAQFTHTEPVARHNLSPGDLVFFRSRRGRINHVGIYLGDNRFIHAPGKGKVISVTSLDNPYWEPRFARGGRPTL